MNKALCAFLVFAGLGLIGLMIFVPISSPAAGFANKPALTTHTAYTVQEIDGCEYIVYQVHPRGNECRMIHKENCQNHPPAQILYKGR